MSDRLFCGLAVHEAADLFPLITGPDFDAFVEDIREHGQRDPIMLDGEDRIIDGRNRARACERLGIRPTTKRYEGDDVLAFVVSHNLHRRHLTDSQRAMVAAKLATRQSGMNGGVVQHRQDRGDITTVPPTLQQAADLLAVTKTAVQTAKIIHAEGTPKLQALVAEGHAPVATAARVAREMTPDEQNEYVGKVMGGADPVKAAPPDLVQRERREAVKAPRLVIPQPPKLGGNRRKHLEQIEAVCVSLSGLVAAFDGVTTLDASVTSEEAGRLTSDLSSSIRHLNRLNSLIKERTS